MRYALLFLFAFTTAVFGQSGLNNIPSADTTPQGTWVPQVSTTIGRGRDADLKLGLKTGLKLGPARAEVGFSNTTYPGKGGPMRLHSKVALPLGARWPVIALGVANVTTEERYQDRVGEEYFYLVMSHDLQWARLHAGCALQDSETLSFFGIDKTFYREVEKPPSSDDGKSSKSPNKLETERRKLGTVRVDVFQQVSHDWVWAIGGLVPICDHLNFESWANFPTNGDKPSLTLKFNFYVRF